MNAEGYPAPLLALQPHLRFVTEAAAPREDARAASLCNELGYHLDLVGDYAAARPLYERALQICVEVLGSEHPTTRQIRANLTAFDAGE